MTKEIPDNEKTQEDWEALPKIVVLTVGIVEAMVCAKEGTSIEEVEKFLNHEHSTGISSPWRVNVPASGFSCPDGRPEAKHYILSC